MNPVPKTVVRYTLLIVTAAVLQKAVFSQLRIDGAVPDALLVLAVAAGVVSGSERGATVGFCSGLALDLMVTTPSASARSAISPPAPWPVRSRPPWCAPPGGSPWPSPR